MNDFPPAVPRHGGGHAADRLREQLEREYGITAPDDQPEPAKASEAGSPDSPDVDPGDAGPDDAGSGTDAGRDDAGPAEAGPGGGAQPERGEQQGH